MRLLRMIWFSLFVSIVIYAVMAFLFGQRGASRPFDTAVRDQFVIIIYVLSLLIFLVAFFYPSFLPQQPLQTRMIISLALFESCTVMGLVVAFVTQDWRLILAPLALTLVGFFRTFPTGEPL